jgi:hypothetical protein
VLKLWRFCGRFLRSNPLQQEITTPQENHYNVISTHGNLLSMMLHHFDPTVDFTFWKSMTLPDIYQLQIQPGGGEFRRLWGEEGIT